MHLDNSVYPGMNGERVNTQSDYTSSRHVLRMLVETKKKGSALLVMDVSFEPRLESRRDAAELMPAVGCL